jgi:medium-chain acyl-[acyl-carrier-protein] hydrolase
LDRVTPWLQFRPAAGNQRLRLFCLPHAGGGATTYHSWTAELPAFVQLCPVLLPGRETRLSEALYTQIDPLLGALDRELRPWLDIPYAVFGHSMGALLAFAWVRILQREGASMPVWLFLSGRRAPDTPGDTNLLHALPDGEFVKELTRRYNGIPQEVSENEALMEVFLPILRADIAVVESYRFQEDEPLDCPITVFSGIDDASVSWDKLLAWKRHTSQRFAMQVLPGGHFYPQRPLLQTISATLAELRSQSGSWFE